MEANPDWWLKIFGIAFAAWAAMLPLAVMMVNKAVSRVVAVQEKFQHSFEQYVLTMERRVTIVEERQGMLTRRIDQIEESDRAANREG